MILLNFSHPLTPEQLGQIEALTQQRLDQVVEMPVHFDAAQPFLTQLNSLMERMPLDARALQTSQILINPPALNFITAILLADLHGRMGYFPPVLRLRQVAESLPPRYEVFEILNLQTVRDQARGKRT